MAPHSPFNDTAGKKNGNTTSDHIVKVIVVAVKVEIYLIPVDIGDTPSVIEILIIMTKIGLSEVGLGVINDKIDLFTQRKVEFSFKLFYKKRSFSVSILSQSLRGGIKIDIILDCPEILPIEFLILNSIFSKSEQ